MPRRLADVVASFFSFSDLPYSGAVDGKSVEIIKNDALFDVKLEQK